MVSFCTSSTATGASSFYPDSMEDRVDSDSGVMRCGLQSTDQDRLLNGISYLNPARTKSSCYDMCHCHLGSSTALDLWRRGDNNFLNMLSLGIGQDTMQGTRTPRTMASLHVESSDAGRIGYCAPEHSSTENQISPVPSGMFALPDRSCGMVERTKPSLSARLKGQK